jgi:hypothetical protein
MATLFWEVRIAVILLTLRLDAHHRLIFGAVDPHPRSPKVTRSSRADLDSVAQPARVKSGF